MKKTRKKTRYWLRDKTVNGAIEDSQKRVVAVLAQLRGLDPSHAQSVLRAASTLLEGRTMTISA